MNDSMSKRLVQAIFFIFCLLLLGGGCQKQQKQTAEEPFIAKVGETRITPEEFSRELSRRGGEVTVETREAVLRNMIRTEELLTKARADGFDREPETVARVKKVIASLYEEKLRGEDRAATNSPAAAQEYYQTHMTEFVTPARTRVAMIFWQVPKKATEEKRKEFRGRAEVVAAEAEKLPTEAVGFGELARLNSEDQPTRYVGGDLGLKTEPELAARFGAELAKRLFSLEPRKLSGVIEGPEGLYLFKAVERHEQQTKPLAEVKDLVAYRVTQANKAELDKAIEGKLTTGVAVQINRQLLEKTAPLTNTTKAVPPGAPAP
jgi:peptidyl-prolyl cis-trans isomerase C